MASVSTVNKELKMTTSKPFSGVSLYAIKEKITVVIRCSIGCIRKPHGGACLSCELFGMYGVVARSKAAHSSS